jgi:hypothetical protein
MCSNEHDLTDRPEQHQIVWDCGQYGNPSGAHSPELGQAEGSYLRTLWVKTVISTLSPNRDLVLDATLQRICRMIA